MPLPYGNRLLADLLIVVVTLSMAVTPVLSTVHEKLLRPRFAQKVTREYDVAPDEEAPVIIAGFGRVGQVVGRVLRAKKIAFTAMDANPEHIEFIKKFGNKVFYGDASRLDLLHAAKAEKAKVFVLAIDDIDASLRTVQTVIEHFPHLTIFARARNRQHAYRLLDLGVRHLMRETFLSSLDMTGQILEALGMSHADSHRAMERFREHDEGLLLKNYRLAKDSVALQQMAAQSRQELEDIFNADAKDQKTA